MQVLLRSFMLLNWCTTLERTTMPESLSFVRCSVHPHALQLQQAVFDTGTALELLDLMERKMKQVVDPESSPLSKGFNAFCAYDPNPNVVSGPHSEEPICW